MKLARGRQAGFLLFYLVSRCWDTRRSWPTAPAAGSSIERIKKDYQTMGKQDDVIALFHSVRCKAVFIHIGLCMSGTGNGWENVVIKLI